MKTKELTYADVRFGDRAIEAYKSGRNVFDIYKTEPRAINTRPLPGKVGGLTVADALTARVLQGEPFWLMGSSGTGKSLWLDDFRNHLAGGQFNPGQQNSGECYMAEVLIGTQPDELGFDRQEKIPGNGFEWRPTGRHNTTMFFLDEILHAIGPVQGTLQGVTQGRYMQHGLDLELGKEGYFLCGVTSNDPRDSAYGTTNEASFSLYDRFPFVLNFGSEEFGPTANDLRWIRLLNTGTSSTFKDRERKSNVIPQIIKASKKIREDSFDLGVKAESVLSYLDGLSYCPGKNSSGKKQRKVLMDDGIWPNACSDCSRDRAQEGKDSPLCRQLSYGGMRFLGSMKGYISALDFMARLKNQWRKQRGEKELEVDPADLVFSALEFCAGRSQEHGGILNPIILRDVYHNRDSSMTRNLTERLKTDYATARDEIEATLEASRKGKTAKYVTNPTINPPEEQLSTGDEGDFIKTAKDTCIKRGKVARGFLPRTIKELEEVETIEQLVPTRKVEFSDDREVPLGHISDDADFKRENFKQKNHLGE